MEADELKAREDRRRACVETGGHYWPADAPEDESVPCTRCGYDPGWVKGDAPADVLIVKPEKGEILAIDVDLAALLQRLEAELASYTSRDGWLHEGAAHLTRAIGDLDLVVQNRRARDAGGGPPVDLEQLVVVVWQATQECGYSTVCGDEVAAKVREMLGQPA